MKWVINTQYITSRGYSRLWILRNLKKIGANEKTLIDIYIKQVRSILENACPVWSAGLTHTDKSNIEGVQKIALTIIRGETYPYRQSLEYFGLQSL